MSRARFPLTLLLIAAAAAPAAAGAARASVDPGADRLQWATINACNPADDVGAVGIRGSMPGDGVATQRMFMRLQVQFQGPKGGWRFFSGTVGDSGFLPMGSAKQRKHQAGQTFQVVPNGKTFVLRGVATYQWRAADGSIVRQERELTTAGHVSSAGDDPPGFTAATCTI